MSKLLRIAYCSRSSVTGSRAEVEMQIRMILATARTNNRKASISGAMTFNENFFAQVLEGSSSDLDPLFGRIYNDPRHRDVKILAETEPMHRLFPHWSMAFVNTSNGGKHHPLSHFSFEAALTADAAPQGEQLLEALRQVVVVASRNNTL